MRIKIPFLLLVAALFFTSCEETPQIIETPELKNAVKNENSEFIQEWINLYMVIEKDLPGFRPAATSRALAYIWMSAYEAGLPGMPNFISNAKKLNFPIPTIDKPIEDYNYAIAINAALAKSYDHFLHNKTEQQKNLILSTERLINEKFSKGVSPAVMENSIAWGRKVADAVIAYSKTDVEAEKQILDAFAKDYTPPTGIGKWKGEKGTALFPYWGKVRTFTTFGQSLISPPPPPFSTDKASKYYKDFDEVNEVVSNFNNERRWKSEFWSDDIVGLTFSPPARIFMIANQMIAKENLDLETSLHLLLKLGIAENDAAVAAWGSKYIYNVERPTHYIREYINKDFRTPLGYAIGTDNITPPFPGYPSGHSTFGGISIPILAEFFGESYTFTDRCHEGRTEFNGTPRTYTNMTQIGEENAYSRITLGVHPRFDCDEGLRLGKMIGNNTIKYRLTKN